jgi:hypothetical protein
MENCASLKEEFNEQRSDKNIKYENTPFDGGHPTLSGL